MIIRTQQIKLLVILLLFITACNSNNVSKTENYLPNTITVKGDKFVDNLGRQVILNGINIVSKSKKEGYIFPSGPELYENLTHWGANCIRFYISWDRLESEPGIYNEEYLMEIDQRIAWAKENNLFVVLDMHQDLFSAKFDNGAPEWAALDEGKPHTTGLIWSDAYLLSEAVQTSFDNFWLNKPASDGKGVQDHYALLWQHIARRYANSSTVIGYDLMNEPFPGTSAKQSTMILLKSYGELKYKLTGEILTEEQLVYMWGDEKSRMQVLNDLSTKENFDFVFSKLFELNKEFEVNYLQSMYQKVANAIREVDTKHILFLEHSYFSNSGVKSSLERVLLADGSPDPFVAYAPHGYDLVTDTDAVALASNERVSHIFSRISEKGKQLKMPVWLGEWGAFYGNSESVIPVAIDAISLIEQNLFGNAYWSYDPGTENLEYFKKVLIRPYPSYVNGELISYQNNFETATFTMEWRENEQIASPTVLYIPNISKLKKDQVNDFSIKELKNSDAGYLIIPPKNDGSKRNLILMFR